MQCPNSSDPSMPDNGIYADICAYNITKNFLMKGSKTKDIAMKAGDVASVEENYTVCIAVKVECLFSDQLLPVADSMSMTKNP